MPRQGRKKSSTGIYHVMLRGINRQRIFEKAEDYGMFMDSLCDVKEQSGFTLYAYCLMCNHVHLLLKEGAEPLAMIFRRLGTRYAYWFNKKYGRSGHLFQDRFGSEPVETDEYFMTVLIYIYRNPVEAGVCPLPADYEWGSRRFLGKGDGIADDAALLAIFPVDTIKRKEAGPAGYKALVQVRGRRPAYADKDVAIIMRQLCGALSASDFQNMPVEEQRRITTEMRQSLVPIRQIARVTGLSKGIVENWGRREG
jgi:REP element-mobilizing transposase RayT